MVEMSGYMYLKNNHFSSSKISTLKSDWENATPCFIVPLILKGSHEESLSTIADDLRNKLIDTIYPCEN